MNRKTQKRIVVVLGMHRSGTSAITKGLQVFGISLGDNLIAPILGNNDKGFWEDVDVNALNDELLSALGHSWHSLEPVLPEECRTKLADFKLRAVLLLREKFASTDVFGIKDPRIARLLPFWQQVFEHLQLRVSYVIACRNPLSVARSLAKRNSFDPQKTHCLWIEHELSSLIHTKGQSRLVVSYDSLLDDPVEQLTRIAKQLELEFDACSDVVDKYKNDFLEESLRHTYFDSVDVVLDKTIPTLAVDLYRLLTALASDQLDPDSNEANEIVDACAGLWHAMAPTLAYLRISDERVADLKQLVCDRDTLVATRDNDVFECRNEISGLARALADRECQIAALQRTCSNEKELVAELRRDMLMREDQISALNSRIAGQESQLAARSEAVTELDLRVAVLTESLEWSGEEICKLNGEIAQREAQRAQLNEEIDRRDAQVTLLTRAVEQRETQIFSLTLGMREVQEEFAILKQKNAVMAELISRQMRATRSHKEHIAALNRRTHARAEQIATLRRSAIERERQIAVLNQCSENDKNEIDGLKRSLDERERKLGELVRNGTRDGELEAMTQAAAAFEQEIASLREDLRDRDRQVEALSRLQAAIDGVADVLDFETRHNGFIQ